MSYVRTLGAISLQVEIGKRLPSEDDIKESLTLQNPVSAIESRAARSAVSADSGQTYVICA
jgi:hypothetical protein